MREVEFVIATLEVEENDVIPLYLQAWSVHQPSQFDRSALIDSVLSMSSCNAFGFFVPVIRNTSKKRVPRESIASVFSPHSSRFVSLILSS
jgi:hypothetical protein